MFLEKIVGQCSGYACACGWRKLVTTPLATRMSPQLLWQTASELDYTIERATKSVAYGNNVLADGLDDVFGIDAEGADIAFPIPFATVDTLTTDQFIPVFQSPGTTLLWIDPAARTNVAEAIFSTSVLSILVAVFLIILVFGIVVWLAETRLSKKTRYPKTAVAGTGYSIWYCTCMLVGVSFDNFHPRSKVSRVLIMVFAYVKVFALISLNAEMLLALQPENRPPLSSHLPGQLILAVQNSPDEARALSFGATVISVSSMGAALETLAGNDTISGIAVDTLLVNFVVHRAKRDLQMELSTSGTLPNQVDYGYLLSKQFAQRAAVSFSSNSSVTTMGQCMALASAAFSGDTVAALRSYLPTPDKASAKPDNKWSLPLQATVVAIVYGFYSLSAIYRHVKEQEYKKRAGDLGRKLISAARTTTALGGKSASTASMEEYAGMSEESFDNPSFDRSSFRDGTVEAAEEATARDPKPLA